MSIEAEVVNVLKTTYDPEIPVNIYDLGLIYDIEVDDNKKVRVTMTLTAPNCPVADSLPHGDQGKGCSHRRGIRSGYQSGV